MQESAFPSLALYTIKMAIIGHIVGFSGNKALINFEPVTHCTWLAIKPWVIKAAPQKLSIASEPSLLLDKVKPGPSDITQGVLSSVSRQMPQCWWRPCHSQSPKQLGSPLESNESPAVGVHTFYWWYHHRHTSVESRCFHPLTRMSPIKGKT